MPTTLNNFRFSLHKSLPVVFAVISILLASTLSNYAQSGGDFTKPFRLSPTGTGIFDLYVHPDGSSRLTTIAGYGPAGIELFQISPEGEITDQQYLVTGDPIDFKIIPYGSGFITYGTLLECDLLAPPSVTLYDSAGNQILELLYEDLNIQSFDSIFVLPLSNTDFWVFRTNTPPQKYNAGGFLTAIANAAEPIFNASVQLTDNQYLVWGKPGLGLYNSSLTQQTFSLINHEIRDVSVMENGAIAALSQDSVWVLDNNLSVLKGIKLHASGCIGLESDSNFIYLMYAYAPEARLYQLNENLIVEQIIPVVSTSELKPGKFRCRNGNLYYTGDNSRTVSGFRKTSLLQPAQDTMPTDGGIIEILSNNPITTYYSNFQGFASKWSGVSVVVKNHGTDVINQITINSFFSQFSFICLQNFTFSKRFDNLNIQPGASDTIALPELSWYNLTPPTTATAALCFWTSLPNDSLDTDVTNDEFCDQFPIVVSIINVPGYQKMSVAPNPATETATISLPETMSTFVSVQLINQLGKTVQNINNQGLANIPVYRNNLPAGIYVVKVTDDKGTVAIGKIVFD